MTNVSQVDLKRWASRKLRLQSYFSSRLLERSSAIDNVFRSTGLNSCGLVPHLNAQSIDVINLHWISDLLSIKDIGALRAPVFWTVHDMWPLCGGEHYVDDTTFDLKYCRDGSPLTDVSLSVDASDIDSKIWRQKLKRWRSDSFAVISPSKWLAERVAKSVLFRSSPIRVIPNAIDTLGIWRSTCKRAARQALRLPLDRPLLLLGVQGTAPDMRKGSDFLQEIVARALSITGKQIELIVFGPSAGVPQGTFGCEVHALGHLSDDRLLALAYSAADVFVLPARQDNLPNTAVESLACGTPVVAFSIGGLPDILNHKVTGWLSQPFDLADMAQGIAWLLQDTIRLEKMSDECRSTAHARFGESAVAGAYANFYQQRLGK